MHRRMPFTLPADALGAARTRSQPSPSAVAQQHAADLVGGGLHEGNAHGEGSNQPNEELDLVGRTPHS